MSTGLQDNDNKLNRLRRIVYLFSLFNLLLIALIGVFLRSIPATDFAIAYYKNILHAHSHFAFGGWIMPALLVLLIQYYPELVNKIAYRHWRNIAGLLLLSAYGMLFSFPFQGYGPVSITFSTLSIFASYYLAFVIWKVKDESTNSTSHSFLLAGLFYLVLSSIGPFATAPLIAMGKAGTALYFNAIYFYLHFQYNGWFSFLLLGVLYKIIGESKARNGNRVFILFNIACIPAYFLSTLWSHPTVVFYVLGAGAAFIQVVALFFLWKDIVNIKRMGQRLHPFIYLALLVFSVKLILQLVGAIPGIANMAYEYKNFIIAYLHLVLLGFVSLFIFGAMAVQTKQSAIKNMAMSLFIVTWIITELILTLKAFAEVYSFAFTGYEKWILAASCLFPVTVFFLWFDEWKRKPGVKK